MKKYFQEVQEKLLANQIFIFQMMILGLILSFLSIQEFELPSIQRGYATLTGAILNYTYTPTTVQGQFIETQKETYRIIRDCTGWKSLYLFAALTITTTKSKSKIIDYLITGTIIVIAINFVRLYTTIVLSEMGIISFEIIHNWIWNTGMIITTLIIWHIITQRKITIRNFSDKINQYFKT